MEREENLGGGCKSEVFALKESFKTKPQVFPSAFLHFFFSWERETSGEGELLKQFRVRGLGRFCQIGENIG